MPNTSDNPLQDDGFRVLLHALDGAILPLHGEDSRKDEARRDSSNTTRKKETHPQTTCVKHHMCPRASCLCGRVTRHALTSAGLPSSTSPRAVRPKKVGGGHHTGDGDRVWLHALDGAVLPLHGEDSGQDEARRDAARVCVPDHNVSVVGPGDQLQRRERELGREGVRKGVS